MTHGMHDGSVIALPRQRLAEAVDVLCESFADYPAVRYFIGPTGDAFPERLRLLMQFFTSVRFLRDELVLAAVTADDTVVGVANVTLPGVTRSPAELAAKRDAVWREFGPDAHDRYLRFGELNEPLGVDGPTYHLNLLGVRAAVQGTGVGGALLDDIHARSRDDDDSTGVTLTTEDPANVAFYERRGYAITGRVRIADFDSWGFFRPDEHSKAEE